MPWVEDAREVRAADIIEEADLIALAHHSIALSGIMPKRNRFIIARAFEPSLNPEAVYIIPAECLGKEECKYFGTCGYLLEVGFLHGITPIDKIFRKQS